MRIIVAITGATGAVYGIRLLAALEQLGVERHLIVSRWAEVTIPKETGYTAREVGAMASVVHSRDNQGAPMASGSFRHDGMIVAPCSMKTLSAIRFGYADELIPRAADVTLKERRRLVLLARETPLNEIHLENITIDDLIDHTVGRVLDLFGLEMPQLKRWSGMRSDSEAQTIAELPRIVTRGTEHG